jgi:hypothetical protein
MTLNDFFSEIESISFAIRYSVASGFSTVKNGLQSDETLRDLIQKIQESPEDRQKVFERLIALLGANEQPEYMHPSDEALTAYLYVLSQTDPALTAQAVEHVLQTPKLFWARRLAQELQETAQSTTAN